VRALGYSLQSNRKTKEGASHPDRDAQFEHINAAAKAAIAAGEPVISVDTKKKELVGDFKNGGREWTPAGAPVEVNTHDFPSQASGRAIPYGVYDLAHNEGWVSVGIDHDTAAFAVASIRSWWQHLGAERFPAASTLTITADCGGSNGNRTRLWKTELQRLADDTGLAIRVCHFPPGTSKWNKIEHRLFSFISLNWRAKPLTSRQVIIDLIAATTTNTGLKVYAQTRRAHLPRQGQGLRRRTRRRPDRPPPLPPRMELHDQTAHLKIDSPLASIRVLKSTNRRSASSISPSGSWRVSFSKTCSSTCRFCERW